MTSWEGFSQRSASESSAELNLSPTLKLKARQIQGLNVSRETVKK